MPPGSGQAACSCVLGEWLLKGGGEIFGFESIQTAKAKIATLAKLVHPAFKPARRCGHHIETKTGTLSDTDVSQSVEDCSNKTFCTSVTLSVVCSRRVSVCAICVTFLLSIYAFCCAELQSKHA